MIAIPSDFASNSLASAGTIMTDYSSVLYIVGGFLLAYVGITFLIWLAKKVPGAKGGR